MSDVRTTTLRRRLTVSLTVIIACCLLSGGGAIIGVNGLHQDMTSATRGYEQLRQVYELGFFVATAKHSLTVDVPSPIAAKASLDMAAERLATEPVGLDQAQRDRCRASLREAIDALSVATTSRDDLVARAMPAIDRVFAQLTAVSDGIRSSITLTEAAAARKHRLTLVAVAALSVAAVAAAVLTGVRLYRRILRPLQSLGRSTRRLAGGRWDERVDLSAYDAELAELAADFNRMAGELAAHYHQLEEKVRARTQELVRSERLASVGYLAAGVAHEINNPLGIIAGYAERSLQLLQREPLDDATLPRTRKAIQVMCDEAFRCREITDRLLSLARTGDEQRRAVPLALLANEVVATLGGAAACGPRKLQLVVPDGGDRCEVLARVGEVKQVLVNLLINAFEASDPASGVVRVELRRADEDVELEVNDNGVGMDAATLDRAFEPFFSGKRGDDAQGAAPASRPGTGLGLSVTHAIVTDHGGRIWAESAGLGRGSRFVVRLPSIRDAAVISSESEAKA